MKLNSKVFYAIVIALSVVFLFVGNRIASGDDYTQDDFHDISYYSGVVTEIVDRIEEDHPGLWFTSTYIHFNVRITRGERRGDVVAAQQHLSDMFGVDEREIAVGNRVILSYDEFGSRYFFVNFVRINHIVVLGAVFLAMVLLFGRKKGFSAIVSLGLICMAVFMVFIPAILSGRNIYIVTIIICVYAIVSTLLIVIGPTKKALSAMLGCLGGVLLAGLLMAAMDAMLRLTGNVSHEAAALVNISPGVTINLRAIIFAGVILGAVGAIMDVAMSIASSLWEVQEAGGVSDFAGLIKSGLNIGRDILGTMLNTLILAYIGSSLSLILLITAHTTSYMELFNMEMIIVELLRALVGSFGMLLTIPLTAGICGWLYSALTG